MNQFEEMKTYVRIVEAGSITKAAEQLDTVKSAVSRRLAELEKRLGATLLTRTTRSQSLTEVGGIYYHQCLRLIDDLAEVESSISETHTALAGRINVAVPLSFGLAHLEPALRKFNEISTEINFNIDFNDRFVDLIEEGFDLAIRIGQLQDSTLRARPITNTRGVICASPAYLAEKGTPKIPEDLQNGYQKLHYRSSPDKWLFKNTRGEDHTIHVPSVLTTNNGDYLCQAAISGFGLLYSPEFICYKAIEQGLLVPILSEFMPAYKISVYAVYPKTRHLSKRVRSLIDFLVQYFGEEPYWSIEK